ncbi:putative fibrocystin [Sesbania bispinosa]|nr:putative fibrocystin [Sesbania bispinosa]
MASCSEGGIIVATPRTRGRREEGEKQRAICGGGFRSGRWRLENRRRKVCLCRRSVRRHDHGRSCRGGSPSQRGLKN